MFHLVSLALVALLQGAPSNIVSEPLAYSDGNVELEGVIFYDESVAKPRPGVIVVHEWWGLNDYAKQRARELAEAGYVAFAIDMYGKGVGSTTPEGAQKLASQVYPPQIMRQRAKVGFEAFAAHPRVDSSQLGAIGFCFGGTTVTQMAYSGLPLKAVVSLHGSLPPLPIEDRGKVQASILVLHGDADTLVPEPAVTAFLNSLRSTEIDWQFVRYSNAKHAFTNPAQKDSTMEGVGYHPVAERRAMQAVREFLAERLGLEAE